jgi:Na+-driven multidrug efflux pump
LFLVISSVLNVLLDIVSVTAFKEELGTAGPAIATVISQLVSGALCLVYMVKKFPILHLQKDEYKLDLSEIKKLLYNGLPMGLQYSITAIGSVTLQSAVNDLGSSVIAAVTAGVKINMFFLCPIDALAGTMATFAGQNIGAKKPKRIKRGILASLLMASVYAICAFVVLYFFSQKIALLFLDATEIAILENVKQFIFFNSLFYISVAVLLIMRMTVQGMGYSDVAVFAGVIEMIVRVALSFGLVPKFGFIAVCFANPLSWSSAAIFLSFVFIWAVKRKTRKLEQAKE